MWMSESMHRLISRSNLPTSDMGFALPSDLTELDVRWEKVLPIWHALHTTGFDENARLDTTIDLMQVDLALHDT